MVYVGHLLRYLGDVIDRLLSYPSVSVRLTHIWFLSMVYIPRVAHQLVMFDGGCPRDTRVNPSGGCHARSPTGNNTIITGTVAICSHDKNDTNVKNV